MLTKCSCQICSGHLEFEASDSGRTIACPHCGMDTTLYIQNVPKPNSLARPLNSKRNLLVFGLLGIVASILVVVLVNKTGDTARAERMVTAERIYINSLHQYYGDSNKPNLEEAARLARQSAELGFAEAQWSLGNSYDTGEGLPQNPSEAAKWYKKAADQGNAAGQRSLGYCYYEGRGVPQDIIKAVKLYQLAAEKGDDIAQCGLALAYLNGKIIAKDEVKAEILLKAAADHGSTVAVEMLKSAGVQYPLGPGVPQSTCERWRLYRKYGEQGDKLSQYALGYELLKDGQGITDKTREGFSWMMKAANQEVISAIYEVGKCQINGIGVEQDIEKGVSRINKLADLGYVAAQCYMGAIIEGKYPKEAVQWYRKAADQNYTIAQKLLAQCYLNGTGVEKDDYLAGRWIRRAAESCDGEAEFEMAIACFAGSFRIDKNNEEGEIWLAKSAKHGCVAAKECQSNKNRLLVYIKKAIEDNNKLVEERKRNQWEKFMKDGEEYLRQNLGEFDKKRIGL